MPDLFEFSRTHCVAICAVLVPANLLATLQTMLLVWFRCSPKQIYTMTIVASFYAMLLVLHVLTWLAIGVVMLPTYILTFMGSLCLLIKLSAVIIASNLPGRWNSKWIRTHG